MSKKRISNRPVMSDCDQDKVNIPSNVKSLKDFKDFLL